MVAALSLEPEKGSTLVFNLSWWTWLREATNHLANSFACQVCINQSEGIVKGGSVTLNSRNRKFQFLSKIKNKPAFCGMVAIHGAIFCLQHQWRTLDPLYLVETCVDHLRLLHWPLQLHLKILLVEELLDNLHMWRWSDFRFLWNVLTWGWTRRGFLLLYYLDNWLEHHELLP